MGPSPIDSLSLRSRPQGCGTPGDATSGSAPTLHHAADVLGGLTARGASGLRVVPGEHLRAVALALGDHAEVEAGVEQLARSDCLP